MFAREIIERCQPMCGEDAKDPPEGYSIHNLRRRGIMRLALLKNIQKDVDIQSYGHACFLSRYSRCLSTPAPGIMNPLAARTSGCNGRWRCSRKLRACRARNSSTEVPGHL